MHAPDPPIPPPLRGNEAGTFAEDSVVRRLPEIALRTASENDLSEAQLSEVEALAAEIPSGILSRVHEPEAADRTAWAGYLDPLLGVRWIDAPWFFAETYFYRRLLAATGFSRSGPRCGRDPFHRQKQLALDGAMDLAARLGDALNDMPTLLGASLWANRVDLSLWPAGSVDADDRTDAVIGSQMRERLLVNDSAPVTAILNRGAVNLHLVLDNSGAELVADLALAAAVLNGSGRVTLHVKPHPTFVSDVTVPDLEATIERLGAAASPARSIADSLNAAEERAAIEIAAHPFWVSPLAFWECPADLASDLGEADLIVVKGDANYRRLLGDRHWDPSTPIGQIIRPSRPLVALRTAKAEVAAGLAPRRVAEVTEVDPGWMVNGDWGMIQYAESTGPDDRPLSVHPAK